jgi:glycosidase
MVTEEERQWMWQEYAPESRMRLNLGIRRRLAPLLDNDRRKIEVANSMLFTLIGSPIIYYGDEIGMQGGKDPDCRGSFLWGVDQWNQGLRDWIKKLIHVRKNQIALRQGDFVPIIIGENKEVYAFARSFREESVLVVINPSAKNQIVKIKIEDFNWQSRNPVIGLLGTEKFSIAEDTLVIKLSEWGAAWIGKDKSA